MKLGGRSALGGALVLVLLVLGACSKSETSTPATTSPPGSAQPAGVSTYNASSDELKQWQADLDKVGCSAGPVDGIEGGETEAAIRAFQAASGLTVDGLLGPQTEAALSKAAASGTQVCGTGGGSTGTTASSAPTTTSATPTTPTTMSPSTPCPPNCAPNLAISPGSGPVGTTVSLSSSGTRCAGPVSYLGPGNTGPGSAGELTAQGMNKYGLQFTIPQYPPGTVKFFATACGAVAYFEVTG